MRRRLITIVTLASVTVGIYLASITDRGTNLRAATCGVRISNECLQQYPSLKRYETVRFPVSRDVSDGGLSFVLPRALGSADGIFRECIEVVDWDTCNIDTCATFPAVCNLWDAGQPIVRVRSSSKFVIPDCRGSDGGWDDSLVVDCNRIGILQDGGAGWWGCNTFPRTQSVGTQCLDAPSGVVFAGERIEDSL